MNLIPLKANCTVVEIGHTEILFSYRTPVAYAITAGDQAGVYKTNKYWSRTTTRHINHWLAGRFANDVDQVYLDKIGENISYEK